MKVTEDEVESPSVFAFEKRLDKFWRNQEVKFNYEAALSLVPRTSQQTQQWIQDLGRYLS